MKHTQLPLVSVVMPAYNAEAFIEDAVRSIMAQTYPRWELIVVDDHSTDRTAEIVKSLQTESKNKITLLTLKKRMNSGGDSCANQGIRIAKGAYIARMDADDIARPERLEIQVNYLVDNPEIFMVGSNATVIDADGVTIGVKNVPFTSDELYREYINFHPIIHPTVVFRNEYPGKNFYDIKYPLANDYHTFFSLLLQGKKFVNLPYRLLEYRLYGSNSSLKNVRKGLVMALKIKLDMVSKGYPLTIKAVAQTTAQFAVGFLLPQKVSYTLYMMAKGIWKPSHVIQSLRTSLASQLSFLPTFS